MNRKEASFILANIDRRVCDDELNEALDMAIKALDKEPCGDAVSRQDVLDLAKKGILVSNGNYESVCKAINELPSVNPQPCEECEYKLRGEVEQKTGYWEKTTDGHCYWYRCSCCGTKAPKNEWGSDYFSPYCPECNAKMSDIPTD